MEITLLVITVGSLLAALVLATVAWRLAREQRARTAARIAALAAAAHEDHQSATASFQTTVTAAHQVSASTQPVVTRAPQPVRTGARVEPAVRRLERPVAPWAPPRGAAPLDDSFLRGPAVPPTSGGQRGLAIAAGILLVLVVAGGYYTAFGDRAARDGTLAASPARTPLELMALRHERHDTRLAITGLVRNPAEGGAVEKLSAVALLFDEHGAVVTSSRAGVDYTRLAPGDESPFVLTVDAPPTVARYRVSFRDDAGVVPHVDRRGQEPIARETP